MLSIGHFDYSKKWTSSDDFPTYEASETQVRADMQFLFDEISAFLNDTLIDWVEQQIAAAITGGVPDRSLTKDKIVLGTLTNAEIADATITKAKMAANSIDSDQYVDGSIDPEHLASNAVTTAKIANSNVTTAKIDTGAVTTAKIADKAVTAAKIADNTITPGQIASGAITSAKLASDSVTTAKIASSAVTTVKIDNGAVTDAKLAKPKADLDSDSKVDASQTCAKIVTVSENKTLESADAGKFINCNSASDITITIPTSEAVSFPMGAEIEFCRYGAGAVIFAPATGVTIRSQDSSLTISDRYTCAVLKRLSTNVWLLSGSLG